ncbi:predicted protein [Uncinocarpus reesii 1704]|uniref:Uncharacterized protein n=1 Tax=Uncinocarpus reesii (strain UAMH 1704) TaxID=336963 RepID=C4JMY2_UNCRE|nr:uncharacterized protein UREG_04190 [Uncinocarpus reesii 1704]EEP79344.1 predicted protein [Uncinocarpus reesii 1704]
MDRLPSDGGGKSGQNGRSSSHSRPDPSKHQLRYLRSTCREVRSRYIRPLNRIFKSKLSTGSRLGKEKHSIREQKISWPLPRETLAASLNNEAVRLNFPCANSQRSLISLEPFPDLVSFADRTSAISELDLTDNAQTHQEHELDDVTQNPDTVKVSDADLNKGKCPVLRRKRVFSGNPMASSSRSPLGASGDSHSEALVEPAICPAETVNPADGTISRDTEGPITSLEEVEALVSRAEQKCTNDLQLLKAELEGEIQNIRKEKERLVEEIKVWRFVSDQLAGEISRLKPRCESLQELNDCQKSEREALKKEIKDIKATLVRYGLELGPVSGGSQDLTGGMVLNPSDHEVSQNSTKDLVPTVADTRSARGNLLGLEQRNLDKFRLAKELRSAADRIIGLEAEIELYKKHDFMIRAQNRNVEREKDALREDLLHVKSVAEEAAARLNLAQQHIEKLSSATVIPYCQDFHYVHDISGFLEKWAPVKLKLAQKLGSCRGRMQYHFAVEGES